MHASLVRATKHTTRVSSNIYASVWFLVLSLENTGQKNNIAGYVVMTSQAIG
jgi:hypothetical protein